MSDGFHVHGPHDHELEHAAQSGHGIDSFSGRIAVMTAIMATIGALFGFQGGDTQNQAAMYKNNAAIKKTEASNQWSFYQAKSSKQNLAALGLQLVEDSRKPPFEIEVRRYEVEKAEIKSAAEKLEKASNEFDERSEARMHQHHRWAQATTALQVAIAMAAIALLTRKRWLEKAVFLMSGVGLMVGVLAYLHV